jgi:sortase A
MTETKSNKTSGKSRKHSGKKIRIRRIIYLIGFLFGLSVLFYPTFSNYWNNYRQKQLTSSYEKQISDMEESNGIDYDAEWAKAENYNASLQPIRLPDSFAEGESEKDPDRPYMQCLNLTGDGMMGTVEIPSINITLPIMHTTDSNVLENAAGHLEGSSLPIGGEGTHSVIAAHRGLPSAALFTDLDKVKKGDHFYLHILNQTLAYEVCEIDVVEPTDTDTLGIQEGKDLCTLLTCTPYGVNTQRLLVTGKRVPYDEETKKSEQVNPIGGVSSHTNYLMWSLGGLLLTILFISFLNRRSKRKAKSKKK